MDELQEKGGYLGKLTPRSWSMFFHYIVVTKPIKPHENTKEYWAVVAGIIVIFALSTITDVALEQSGLMQQPFASNPLWLMIFVTFYRNIYVLAGSYLTATLAPDKPMKHSINL